MPANAYPTASYINTTGTGVAIGTNQKAEIHGVLVPATATTVTIADSGGTAFEVNATVMFTSPIPVNTPTMTSSGGTPTILYKDL